VLRSSAVSTSVSRGSSSGSTHMSGYTVDFVHRVPTGPVAASEDVIPALSATPAPGATEYP
jgi:hypothetical protein